MSKTTSKPSGLIQPFMFDNIPIRGIILRVNNLSDHVPTLGDGFDFIDKALAEMLIASAILTHDLKNKASVTLQIQSKGAIPLLVAQCDKSGHLRAYAQLKDKADKNHIHYKTLTDNNPFFAVSVEEGEAETKKIYQSIVALNNTSISSSIEQYFNDSVQLKTYFKVTIGQHNGKLSCGCIFLQALPEKELDVDDWRRMNVILSTIKEEEMLPIYLSEENLLRRLFAEDNIRIYNKKSLNFASDNARNRMKKALVSLGKKQCLSLLKEGPIVMICEFTGVEEIFSTKEICNIFDTTPKKE